MIKVACISCQHPYELDERRLPATGLKMRCPKCGTTFLVHPDARVEAVAQKNTMLGGMVAPARPNVPPPPPPAKIVPPPSPVGAPSPVGDVLDLPSPRAAVPKPPALDELDLPAPRVPRPAASVHDELDLPAPRGAKPAAPPDELDLPAPRVARPMPPGPSTAAKVPAPARAPIAPPFAPPAAPAPAPAPAGDDLDFDLPAPRRAGAGASPRVDLPAPPAAAKAPAAAKPSHPAVYDELDLPAPRGASRALDLDLPAPGGGSDGLDIDLPGPRRPGARKDSVDLPAPKGAMRPQSVKPALADDSRNPFDDLEGGGGLELDLPSPLGGPSPSGPGAKGKGLDFDLDLPAPRGKGSSGLDLDLPAPRGKGSSGLDLDLPAPRGKGSSGLDLDLPAPRGKGSSGLDLDLPAAKRASPGRVLEAADQAFGDLDLPVPKRAGMEIADLPAPRDAADLPAPRGAVDLPAPRDAADLPAPRGASDLPAPRSGADLPAPRGASDLPTPRRGADLPSLGGADGNFADLDLPPPRKPAGRGSVDSDLDLPPPRARGAAAGGDDLDLPPPRARGAKASISEFELPIPEARPGGSRGHGEIDLPDASKDDMEFADLPQERQASTAPGPRAQVDRGASTLGKPEKKPAPARPRSRAVAITLVLILLLAGGGAALSLTPHGPFGYYYAQENFLPGAGDAVRVRATIQHADELALRDTPSDYHAALIELGAARRDAGHNPALLARSLLHESLYQIRFGSEAGGSSRAAAIRSRLEHHRDDPSVALAFAADALREGDRTRASSLLARARGAAPTDPLVDLLEGEIALADGRPADAPDAFRAAEEHGGGATARWGLARTQAQNTDDLTQYDAAIARVLELSPQHVDALFARAERLLAQGDVAQATTLANQVVGAEPLGDATLVSYTALRARAWTFLGGISEASGRTQRALEAYGQAVQADSTYLMATLGEGRMLLSDRPADALGRFEAVLGAETSAEQTLPDGRPVSVAARLGAARAMTQLDRVQEAHASLEALAVERPDDADIQLWLGRVEEELEHPEPAEQHYRESIRIAPQVFEGYLALARLYDSLERGSDAIAVLESARSTVAETAQVHDEIGQYALSRSRLAEAEAAFRQSLALDATLPSARFGLGVTLRRAGRIDEAAAAFEELAAVDPGHPGLALERGLLFEARGEASRAVEFYRQALTQQPDDPNLMLRLGSALVLAEQYDEAEETLAEVQRQMPSSAEAEHYIGRIAFARSHYPEAQQHFDRAIGLDATRGEFFMWSGRAALENNNLGLALSRADQALEHDTSLGDAYYVRGVAELRSAAVRDAQRDLERAIELNPQRFEALAALGDALDQLRQLPAAIAAYERAVAANDANGQWWYELGLLLLDASRTAESAHALSRATLLGDAATPRPGWLADAHRVQGDALRLSNQRAAAIEHYQRYLSIAPATAIDRSEVRSVLMDMGVVPGE